MCVGTLSFLETLFPPSLSCLYAFVYLSISLICLSLFLSVYLSLIPSQLLTWT